MLAEPVLAVGSPLDFPHSVSFGVVTGVGRNLTSGLGLSGMIQTDAAVNPGNSGGALVDVDGVLLGMPTINVQGDVEHRASGIGLAVPASTITPVVAQVLAHGTARRPMLGLMLAERDVPVRGVVARAVVIEAVHDDQQSDPQPGDVVVGLVGSPAR